jgi:hypothetical protein
MERNSGAYTHQQEHAGFGGQSGQELGHGHTEATTPEGATTNEIDARRAAPQHGPEAQEGHRSTRVVEAEGLKRQREEEGTADNR